MADHPNAKAIISLGTVVIFVGIALALTFGMGEWKTMPAATAEAPLPPAVQTH